MKLMFASFDNGRWDTISDLAHHSKYILLSYWYMRTKHKNTELYEFMMQRNSEDNFVLDSGAFTLMMTKNVDLHKDLDAYIDQYIAFVKKYKIKRYIEMDIDSVIGYDKVKQIRRKLETEIGWKCIPVWHKNRGIEDYKQMIDEYDYVAFGGFNDVGNEAVTSEDLPNVKKLIQYANHRGVKVHGLGFTRNEAWEYGFYSVDSSSWAAGRRFGQAAKFEGNRLTRIEKPANTRADYRVVDRNNFVEWCKYQRWVEDKYTRVTGLPLLIRRFVISLYKKLRRELNEKCIENDLYSSIGGGLCGVDVNQPVWVGYGSV